MGAAGRCILYERQWGQSEGGLGGLEAAPDCGNQPGPSGPGSGLYKHLALLEPKRAS